MAQQSMNPMAAFTDFDFSKMMGDFKWPGMDASGLTGLADVGRKNMETVNAANRLAMEGMQAVAKRQMEVFRQSVEDFASVGKTLSGDGSVNEKAAEQTQVMKDAYEKSMGNAREISEMVTRSNTEVFDMLSKRFSENLEEVSSTLKKGNGASK